MNGKPWTANEWSRLRALYPHQSTAKVAKAIRRTLSATYGAAHTLGLHKTEEYLQSPDACRLRRGEHPGLATQFKKGQVPANKGLRRPGWSAGRMKETTFPRTRAAGIPGPRKT